MQASIYRRNYYLIRVNSQNKFLNDENREREIYEETARVINQMISHTKSLLFKVNSLREELESFDQQHDELTDVDDLIDTFRQFQRTLPLTFFSQYPLDNKMAGPFVLRLSKEMSYWRKYLPLVSPILAEIDQIFQEQKKNEAENISLIYFMTVKRITADCNELFKRLKTKIVETLHQSDAQEEKEPDVFLVPTFRQVHNSDALKKVREGLVERMNDAVTVLYRDLDVVSFEAVDHYIADLTPEDNVELLAKKEIRRNKKPKKEIKAYKLSFFEFQGKRQRDEEKKRLKRRKLTNIKLSENKNGLHKTTTSNKSLPNRNSKITLPSIQSLGKDEIRELSKPKKANKQNKQSKFSTDKNRLPPNKYRQQKVELKLKLKL